MPGEQPHPIVSTHLRFERSGHQTHRAVRFDVPPACAELHLHLRYGPKYLDEAVVRALIGETILRQAADLGRASSLHVREPGLSSDEQRRLVAAWQADLASRLLGTDRAGAPAEVRTLVPNLLTFSLDDATGTYRGAGHRHAADQTLVLGVSHASPGLVPGPLPGGTWTLVISAHTLVSPEVDYSIEIGAVSAWTEDPATASA